MHWTTALDKIREVVGPSGWLDDEAELKPYLTEWRKILQGYCRMLVRPANTEQTAKVVAICHQAGIPITPQGGNTGMVGGAVPKDGILLCTSRMRTIRELDVDNSTITVEAGTLLAEVQDAARENGLLFPLSLASEGSCNIGGNIATNAGGNNTIRYGNMRELVLGLEIVLPDGQVWNGLRQLRKCNTGYDLKHLFIGSEGTLGIITAAVLALTPEPRARFTAMATANNWLDLQKLYNIINARLSGAVVAFEVFPHLGMEITIRHINNTNSPFDQPYPFYALIEAVDYGDDAAIRGNLETALGEALEANIITDAVLAVSTQQADNLWRIRETLPQAQSLEADVIKHDISVPVSKIPQYAEQATDLAKETIPACRVLPFGHMGDGNLHFNLLMPEKLDREQYLAYYTEVNRVLHDLAVNMGGSFSAEHGVGLVKCEEMQRYRSTVEMNLMARVKSAIDPANGMNPGKIFGPEKVLSN